MKEKFIGKYMRMAKQVGEDLNPCYSRQIGCVIVRVYNEGAPWESSKLLGTGYNGPPKGSPHCDDPTYLKNIFWPQLDDKEREKIVADVGAQDTCEIMCQKYGNSKICPRKIVGAASGKRLELCSCAHGETNAIINASDDLHGAYIFCWCPVPCFECSKLIINSGISKVFCLTAEKDYSYGSRWLLFNSGVLLIENTADYYLDHD